MHITDYPILREQHHKHGELGMQLPLCMYASSGLWSLYILYRNYIYMCQRLWLLR